MFKITVKNHKRGGIFEQIQNKIKPESMLKNH